MFIAGFPRRGHYYYVVKRGKRVDGKVVHEKILNLGRLDNLTEQRRLEIERELKKLDDPEIINKFQSKILTLGYKLPTGGFDFDVDKIFSYGEELALHRVCQEIELVDVVNGLGYKGGGPDLGKVVEAIAIGRNCCPKSLVKTVDWFKKSYLPLFLELPPEDFTYWVALRALDYLQPALTRKMQVKLYENIRKTYGYECERVDIDITSTYFEGDACILALFGHTRDHRPDRPQLVIAFVLDQKGVLVTHNVWPGNRTDSKSLKPIDRSLSQDFGLNATRVTDRGFATTENLMYMDRKKDRYLVALWADVKSTGLLEKTPPREEWLKIEDGQYATSVVEGRRKYIIAWNESVAQTNRMDRETRVKNAENKLILLQESIKKGKVKSRQKRDGRIGHILRRYRVTKLITINAKRKGFDFSFSRSPRFESSFDYDGYQVFVTTELDMDEKAVIESYRERDRIEKAIRTLKGELGLHPIGMWNKEHVLGMVFIDALAFQLRSLLRMKLKDNNVEMSVEEAFETLEDLKAVHLCVKGDEIKVYRKLPRLNEKTRTLIEVFDMAENGALPFVDVGI